MDPNPSTDEASSFAQEHYNKQDMLKRVRQNKAKSIKKQSTIVLEKEKTSFLTQLGPKHSIQSSAEPFSRKQTFGNLPKIPNLREPSDEAPDFCSQMSSNKRWSEMKFGQSEEGDRASTSFQLKSNKLIQAANGRGRSPSISYESDSNSRPQMKASSASRKRENEFLELPSLNCGSVSGRQVRSSQRLNLALQTDQASQAYTGRGCIGSEYQMAQPGLPIQNQSLTQNSDDECIAQFNDAKMTKKNSLRPTHQSFSVGAKDVDSPSKRDMGAAGILKALNHKLKNSVRLEVEQLDSVIKPKEKRQSIVDTVKDFFATRLLNPKKINEEQKSEQPRSSMASSALRSSIKSTPIIGENTPYTLTLQPKKTKRQRLSSKKSFVLDDAGGGSLNGLPGENDPDKGFVQKNILVEFDKMNGTSSIANENAARNNDPQVSKKNYKVIAPNHPAKIAWNGLILLSTVYIGFFTPFEIAFTTIHSPFSTHIVISAVMALDIVLRSRTTFFHPLTGDQVRKPKQILKYYVSSFGFITDLLAALPLYEIAATWRDPDLYPTVRMLLLIKMFKLFRVQWDLTLGSSSEAMKLLVRLGKLFYFLMIYIHLTACAQFFVANIDKQWKPTQNKFLEDPSLFYEAHPRLQYLISLYTAILILTGNEINPESEVHLLVACILSICGALIIANIFGTVAVVVSTLNRKSQKFQEQVELASSSMRNMKLPDELMEEVREFMMSTHSNLDTQKELDYFMQMISPSLRNKVTKHIFINAITRNAIWQGSQEIIDILINDVSTLLYMPEDRIICQGQSGDSIFLIAKGDCTVWVRDQMKQNQFIKQIGQGEYFGELSILFETARTATVKSSNYCTLACLNRRTFFELCNSFPEIILKMKRKALEYQDPWKRFKILTLKQIDYFSEFLEEPEFFDEIQYHIQEEHVEAGTEILSSGELIKNLVIIVEGHVELVTFDDEGNEISLEHLNQGDIIGQYSVLFSEEIMFTAVAKSNTRILTLSQEFFNEYKDYIDGIEEAVIDAEYHVEEFGVPICDYKTFQFEDSHLAKLRRAVKRACALRKSNILTEKISGAEDTSGIKRQTSADWLNRKPKSPRKKDTAIKRPKRHNLAAKQRRHSVAVRLMPERIREARRSSKMSQVSRSNSRTAVTGFEKLKRGRRSTIVNLQGARKFIKKKSSLGISVSDLSPDSESMKKLDEISHQVDHLKNLIEEGRRQSKFVINSQLCLSKEEISSSSQSSDSSSLSSSNSKSFTRSKHSMSFSSMHTLKSANPNSLRRPSANLSSKRRLSGDIRIKEKSGSLAKNQDSSPFKTHLQTHLISPHPRRFSAVVNEEDQEEINERQIYVLSEHSKEEDSDEEFPRSRPKTLGLFMKRKSGASTNKRTSNASSIKRISGAASSIKRISNASSMKRISNASSIKGISMATKSNVSPNNPRPSTSSGQSRPSLINQVRNAFNLNPDNPDFAATIESQGEDEEAEECEGTGLARLLSGPQQRITGNRTGNCPRELQRVITSDFAGNLDRDLKRGLALEASSMAEERKEEGKRFSGGTSTYSRDFTDARSKTGSRNSITSSRSIARRLMKKYKNE